MSSPPERNAPIALWRIAQALLATLYNLFGEPQDIAQSHTLTRKAHTLLSRWLRAAETLLRHLLLIEASALTLEPTYARQDAKAVRTRKPHFFAPDQPEAWCVSFAAHPYRRLPAGSSAKRSRPGSSARFADAWPLALRYEALLRAYNDPARYARRLARRLARTPEAADAVLKHDDAAASLIGAENIAALRQALPPQRRDSG